MIEPGAVDDLTQGLRVNPRRLALRATRPAATMLRGFEVLVQLVIAAMITAPSGMEPSSGSSTSRTMPRAPISLTGSRACGLDGPAMVMPTVDRSKRNTRGYSTLARSSDHSPVCFA